MMAIQTDIVSLMAKTLLPLMLEAVRRRRPSRSGAGAAAGVVGKRGDGRGSARAADLLGVAARL